MATHLNRQASRAHKGSAETVQKWDLAAVQNIQKLSTPSFSQLAEQYAEVLRLREQVQRLGSRQSTGREPIPQYLIRSGAYSIKNSD